MVFIFIYQLVWFRINKKYKIINLSEENLIICVDLQHFLILLKTKMK